jgi:transcriptional regulator with XRE-family HTH domain
VTTATAPGLHRDRPGFGGLLREWRQARRISQLELSSVSGVSSRHLSFIETGRAKPSREMVLRLARELDVPLRERNALLQAAGYAPAYDETPLDAPRMAMVTAAIDTVLRGHLPFPALAFDSAWDIVRVNDAVSVFTDGLPPDLFRPALGNSVASGNTMRITLSPNGLAPDLVDHDQVRSRMLARMRRQAAASGNAKLAALAEECAAFPHSGAAVATPTEPDIVMPFRLRRGPVVLSLFSAIATFGTATDLTVAELSIETFFPSDEATAAFFTGR